MDHLRYPGFFLGEKQPALEADRSPPSSAEVKNSWSYTYILRYIFISRSSSNNRDKIALARPEFFD
jgi:hypothetical protein